MRIGPFVKCPHPEMIEAIGLINFDFAVVDMEHTPLSSRDLYPLVLAAERRKLPLIVRVPTLSESHIKWCLDLGVRSIQIPSVQRALDVEQIVKYSYFYPQGERGLCRFVRAAEFSHLSKDYYLDEAQKVSLILQIESLEGIENLMQILRAVAKADAKDTTTIFFGPYDLSASLHIPGKVWDPEVLAVITKAIELCKSEGFCVGIFTDTQEGVDYWRKAGADMLEFGSDLQLFMVGARTLFFEKKP